MALIIKENKAASGNHGGSRIAAQIKYIVIHYTGNDGDSDEGNAAYFANNVVKASAHYFVDDDSVTRSVPDLNIAWAVGGTKWADCDKTGGGSMYGIITNANSISIELCDEVKNGAYGASEKTLERAAELCRALMRNYKIPVENVYRHFDVTGKHCPVYMMGKKEWAKFKARLEAADMDNTPRNFAKGAVEWAKENGILLGDTSGNLKLTETVTREELMVFLHRFAQHISEHMGKL